MSLIDLASLVLAPTAVKDGKVYNAIPNDQDFTFSRGTEATRVNSAGLIEKARTNFLLQSNSFDTTWTTVNASVTGGQSGYDGSSDAWLLSKSGAGGRIQQTLTTSAVNTLSVYAKAGTNNWLATAHPTSGVYFNLSNGTVGNIFGSDILEAKIQDVGNGWYRCIVVHTTSPTNIQIYVADGNGNVNGTSGNILIQSAQLEQGLVSTDYIDTTTSSVTVGITDDLPRVDYSGGGCPSLLLEPSRTNLMVQSEGFATSAWTDNATDTNVTANATSSPEGLQNATEIEFTSSSAKIYDQFTNVASSMHIGSVWLKNKDIGSIVVRIEGGAPSIYGKVDVNLEAGTISNPQGDFTPTIENYGDGWYRVAVGDTGSATIASPSFSFDYLSATGSFYVYGAMVEAGSYPTSYIPTYGTSTSRSADSCSLTNASNLIGQSEGTLFIDYATDNAENSGRIIAIGDGTINNRILLRNQDNGTLLYVAASGSSTWSTTYYTPANTGRIKIALAYANNDGILYVNGSSVNSDTSVTVPACSNVYIGTSEYGGSESTNMLVKQAILFPTRLTNDQLAELTK